MFSIVARHAVIRLTLCHTKQVCAKGKRGAAATAGPSLSPDLLEGASEAPADQLEAEVSPYKLTLHTMMYCVLRLHCRRLLSYSLHP